MKRRRMRLAVCACALILGLSGCGAGTAAENGASSTADASTGASSVQPDSTYTDSNGNEVLVFGNLTMTGPFSEKQSYPANDAGLTYGSADGIYPPVPNAEGYYDEYISYFPDLISAVGDNGTEGYVYKTDLFPPAYATTGDVDTARIAAFNEIGERTLPLFAQDGTTMVDTLTTSLR